MTQHVMIDIETGGVEPGAAIFSIGACMFNPDTLDPPSLYFYTEISHKSCEAAGLLLNPDTMNWWSQQKNPPPDGKSTIQNALQQFTLWISNAPSQTGKKTLAYWANSPSFDVTILKHAMNLFNIKWPFPFYMERDVRTIKAVIFRDKNYILDNSHNALEDCRNQVLLVQHAYYNLRGNT